MEAKINSLVNSLGLSVSETFSQLVRLQQIGTKNFFELKLYHETDYRKFNELYAKGNGLSVEDATIKSSNFNINISTPCLEMNLFSEQTISFVKIMSDFVSNEFIKEEILCIMVEHFWDVNLNK